MTITIEEEISSSASLAIEEAREIARNLRPFQLDQIGLASSLEAMLKAAASASGIDFRADVGGLDSRLSKEDEINVYRIVQEAVSNIVRHSQATSARVSVDSLGGRLRLRIEDNGRGSAATGGGVAAGAGRGFGLTGMAERARIIGGRLEVISAPGSGTRIEIDGVLPGTGDERPAEP